MRAVIRLAVAIVRERFAQARIILRADAGFGNAMVLHLCDKLRISYCLGLATNSRLQMLSTRTQMKTCWRYTFAKETWEQDGVCRLFDRFDYKAGTWKRGTTWSSRLRSRREASTLATSLRTSTRDHHEKAYAFYCIRGDAENRIKEFKLDLAAGRTSCHRFLANQFRLLLHVAAAILMSAIQQAAKGTQFAGAQVATIRLRLLKLGARVVETSRRIWLHMSSSYPSQNAWGWVWAALGP